jgi:hypothetical protein
MIHRRHVFSKLTPAERQIHYAINAVELMPSSKVLNEAIILLRTAKDKVSDYVDKKCKDINYRD